MRGIWLRRPEPPELTWPKITSGEREMGEAQWRSLFQGLRFLPAAWLNDPFANRAAEAKLPQLRAAAEAGFKVPETLVTNSRSAALEFLETVGGNAVIKAIDTPLLPREGEAPQFIFTRRANVEALSRSLELEPIPFILQRRIWPKTDIRVTVVEESVFCAELADPRQTLDWRQLSPPAKFQRAQLPVEIEQLCREVVRRWNLRFGAIDLLRDESGQHHFLEVNPNGEWGWLQKTCGLPIAEAIVAALTRQ